MIIVVHVKDKDFAIETGDSTQRLRWLANVGVFRYEWESKTKVSAPKLIRQENGAFMNPDHMIGNCLSERCHIWVILSDEYDPKMLEYN